MALRDRGEVCCLSWQETRNDSQRGSRTLIADESGQGVAEYIIIAILVAVLVIVALRHFGGSLGERFESATESIEKLGEDDSDGSVSVGYGHGDSSQGTFEDSVSQRESEHSESGRGSAGDSGELAAGDDLSKRVDSLSSGVGESDQGAGEVSLDWWTIGLIAFFVCAIGLFVIHRLRQKTPLSGRKKVKKKKKRFSLFSKEQQEGDS